MNGARARALRTPERPNPGRKHGGAAKVGVVRERNYSPSYADRKAANRQWTGRAGRERLAGLIAGAAESVKAMLKKAKEDA